MTMSPSGLHPLANPTTSERLLLMAVGGYGRGEMALHSDVDIAFVTPWKPSDWTETVVEAILYLLWDLGLKVGHSTRSIEELVRAAAADHTVRTAILESRYVWGDEKLCRRGPGAVLEAGRFGQGPHLRQGEARRARRPPPADGRQPLRRRAQHQGGQGRPPRPPHPVLDRQICLSPPSVAELVEAGLFSQAEMRQFQRAERFLWAVRCHLHILAGRAEERLTFDYQREIASRLHYADRPGKPPVERFMRHYFLHAKTVGDLTGVFLAHLDEKFARRGQRLYSPSLRRRPSKLEGFMLDRGRLAVPDDDFLAEDPVRLIQMFALADRYGLEIHPLTMRAAAARPS